MVLKRIGPFSCAKVSAVVNALFGLIAGIFFSLIALVGTAIGNSSASALFGIGAVIILPIFYGGIGFILGAVMAWLYNLVAEWIGGIEVEFKNDSSSPQHPSVTG